MGFVPFLKDYPALLWKSYPGLQGRAFHPSVALLGECSSSTRALQCPGRGVSGSRAAWSSAVSQCSVEGSLREVVLKHLGSEGRSMGLDLGLPGGC